MATSKRILSARLGKKEVRLECEGEFLPSLSGLVDQFGELWRICFGADPPRVTDGATKVLSSTVELRDSGPNAVQIKLGSHCVRCGYWFQGDTVENVQAQILAHECPEDFREIVPKSTEEGEPAE